MFDPKKLYMEAFVDDVVDSFRYHRSAERSIDRAVDGRGEDYPKIAEDDAWQRPEEQVKESLPPLVNEHIPGESAEADQADTWTLVDQTDGNSSMSLQSIRSALSKPLARVIGGCVVVILVAIAAVRRIMQTRKLTLYARTQKAVIDKKSHCV